MKKNQPFTNVGMCTVTKADPWLNVKTASLEQTEQILLLSIFFLLFFLHNFEV